MALSYWPGEITVDRINRPPLMPVFDVFIRRGDGSLFYLARVWDADAATACADHIRGAIASEEPWVMKLIDVSAGELRAS